MVSFSRSVWKKLHRAEKIYTGSARGARDKYEVWIECAVIKCEEMSRGALPPGLHVLHIGHWRVVLYRHEAETDSVKELDAVHA